MMAVLGRLVGPWALAWHSEVPVTLCLHVFTSRCAFFYGFERVSGGCLYVGLSSGKERVFQEWAQEWEYDTARFFYSLGDI
jgi:hypothetical protein